MKSSGATFFFALVLLFFSFSACKEEETPEENLRLRMLEEVNKVRRQGCQCGPDFLPPVHEISWNDTLEAAALFHAVDMVQNNYFSHTSPEGTFPIFRANAAGYSGNYVSENIARGYSTVQEVMHGWIKSESHCKTIMDTTYHEMGAARYQDHWVQEFGGYH